MPPPIRVEMFPYSADWPVSARREMEALVEAVGAGVCEVHHIGSTAVPGLVAKPILDLMVVVAELSVIDGAAACFGRLGYCGWGELGIEGRRYFTKDDESGLRVAQLHCFREGSPDVERHVAFRDYLRAHEAVAAEYQGEKLRCAGLHASDSHAYGDCKADWIRRVEVEALLWYREVAGERQ